MKKKGFVGLLVAVLAMMVFPIVATAQSPEMSGIRARLLVQAIPSLSWNPTWEHCQTLGEAYSEAMDEIHELGTECKDNTKMEPSKAQDIGPNCHRWAGSAANAWCVSIHPQCVTAEEAWYEVAVERDEKMSECYQRARDARRDKEEAQSAFDRERWFYNHTFDFARKWQIGGAVQSKVIETSMNEIKSRHKRLLDELDELIEDMEDFE